MRLLHIPFHIYDKLNQIQNPCYTFLLIFKSSSLFLWHGFRCNDYKIPSQHWDYHQSTIFKEGIMYECLYIKSSISNGAYLYELGFKSKVESWHLFTFPHGNFMKPQI